LASAKQEQQTSKAIRQYLGFAGSNLDRVICAGSTPIFIDLSRQNKLGNKPVVS
jgi:hypothetical protein